MKRNAIFACGVCLGLVVLLLGAASSSDPDEGIAPIAMAVVNSSGNIDCGTPNVAVQWDAVNEWFIIEIADENIHFSEYVTLVTPRSHVMASVLSDGGKLIVALTNSEGQRVRTAFQFVTYKCPES